VVDASGQQTYLTSRYYDEHSENFTAQKMELFFDSGSAEQSAATGVCGGDDSIDDWAADVQAHYIQVITAPIGLAALDDVYGVLGLDFLDQLKSYTFDYRTMKFGVRTE